MRYNETIFEEKIYEQGTAINRYSQAVYILSIFNIFNLLYCIFSTQYFKI
jgi:hypothetical protein